VLARRRASFPSLDGERIAERDDRASAAILAGVIDRPHVVAFIHRARLDRKAALAGGVDQGGGLGGLV